LALRGASCDAAQRTLADVRRRLFTEKNERRYFRIVAGFRDHRASIRMADEDHGAFDAALLKRAKEIISGTISIAFETDSDGNVRRRTKVTKLDITGPDGPSEKETVTETLERRLISRRD
jgi:hypothetical protein